MKKQLALLITLSAIISCRNDGDETEERPKKRDITESVYASVKVTPDISYYPQSLTSGIINKIYVKEGDLIKKGQILFEITPSTDVMGQITNAQINLSETKSNFKGRNNLLNNIELEIQTSREQYRLDSANLKKQGRLLSQNIGTRDDFDRLKLKYENTTNQLEILEQKYIQTKNTLESNYKKALNSIKTERNQLANFKVFSKMDGKIYAVNKEEGDFISAQEKFAEIGSNDSFKIEMDIDEIDITKIEVGDSVLITLDAYSNTVFLANVNNVFPKKNDVTQTFRVESRFTELPPKLYYGLSGEANIIVSRRKNALVIPADYLLPNNRVLTPEGEKSVTVGLKNLAIVEILSGIDTTTTLIKPEE
jgi:HlyD family secretion protein